MCTLITCIKGTTTRRMVVCILIYLFFQRSFTTKNKAESGNNNVYFNDAYCTGFGEQAIETKCGDQDFSGNVHVPEANLGEHYYAAVDDLRASTNHSAAVLKFPDSLAGKNNKDVAAPTYETLNSGVNVDASIYQNLNYNTSPEI